jgi:alpha/beta superfamily hydrolase
VGLHSILARFSFGSLKAMNLMDIMEQLSVLIIIGGSAAPTQNAFVRLWRIADYCR